jgi:hypothetical protein
MSLPHLSTGRPVRPAFKISLAEVQGKSTLWATSCAAWLVGVVTIFTDRNLGRGISVAGGGMGVTHREGGGR